MRSVLVFALALLLTAGIQPCPGQFVRPPPIIRPPAPIIHPPVVHVPVTHGGQGPGAGNAGDSDVLWWVLGIVGGGGALALVAFLLYRWRKRSAPRAHIRIKAVPPGEAPEFVRRAWVGLDLPVIAGQVQAEMGPAFGALSHQCVIAPPSYAVDGKTAIMILQSATPEIAAWWRENAPAVVRPGFQLIFPADVCERLDDLGG
jgi:hypothetical protein